MQKALLLVVSLIILAGCAQTSLIGGSVDKSVRDYNALRVSGKTKKVNYYCNFDKIAAGIGEYCIGGENQDYVSYFTKFDAAPSRNHLIQTVSAINSGHIGGQLKYYQIYAPHDSFEKLKAYDIENTPPTSFAIKDGDVYRLVITKSDLLMRMKIYPELNILDVEEDSTGVYIGDYTVVYRITPYVFKTKYTDSEISRILGLPDYTELAGKLDNVRKIQLNNYISALNNYWQSPDTYKYDTDKIATIDYAMPQLLLPKLPGAQSDIKLKTSPPFPLEGLLNSYLPPYELEKIMIIHTDSSGNETTAHVYEREELLKVLISYDNDALAYSDIIPDGTVSVRFVHKASAPAVTGMSASTAEALGLGWIYSDIASTIETNLYLERFHQLEQVPRACIDREKFIISFIDKGYSKSYAEELLNRMNPTKPTACSPVHKSIGEQLSGAM